MMECRFKTLPKAQRTRGLSSSYQSNFLMPWHSLTQSTRNLVIKLGPRLVSSKLVEYAASAAAEFKYLWFYWVYKPCNIAGCWLELSPRYSQSAVCPLFVVPLTILTTSDLASQFKFDFQEAEKAGVKLTGRKPKQTKKL